MVGIFTITLKSTFMFHKPFCTLYFTIQSKNKHAEDQVELDKSPDAYNRIKFPKLVPKLLFIWKTKYEKIQKVIIQNFMVI